jgi:hypothetical protein
MVNLALRQELVAMKEEDLRVRKELADAGELGGPYVPRMQAVHVRKSNRRRRTKAFDCMFISYGGCVHLS